MDFFNYKRRRTTEVRIGKTPLGGDNPIRIQSMTNTPTQEVEKSVEQCIRIIEAGADYVRLTAQGTREAESLAAIEDELHRRGYRTPLVADIHFNPHASTPATSSTAPVRSSTSIIPTKSMPPSCNGCVPGLSGCSTSAVSITRPYASV